MARTSTSHDAKDRIVHRFAWRHATCRVVHTRNFINLGWSQLEIFVVKPKHAPLPITETGYRAHYVDETELERAGGAIAFFTAWLDREAKSKAWAKTEFRWRQLELFQ